MICVEDNSLQRETYKCTKLDADIVHLIHYSSITVRNRFIFNACKFQRNDKYFQVVRY